MIRLIVAEDRAIVRAGLCLLLNSEPEIQVVGDSGNGRDALRLCSELIPDVLLLELDLPELDGLEVTRQLVERGAATRVLVLTLHEDEEYAARALQAGGMGFASKRISPKDLFAAIRKVASGKPYVCSALMEKTFMRLQSVGRNRCLSGLSDRELQVFTRLAHGMQPKEIAGELCLSSSSVRTYKQRIMEKLSLESLADLIRLAFQNNILGKY